ncbi:hypothetical protein K5L04_06680 [Flavobacterium psychrophilum]|uniref:hypothetical protein n=1 Tax=Flavobacterium psychrophilum TaxID=96345 RepID=UPI001C8F708F|nr:hypothetical protein [Flavobacterium psychrophilum]QZK99417.1 hypothetical protein K5L04_06680 [Flavobacterium psychrophilum]
MKKNRTLKLIFLHLVVLFQSCASINNYEENDLKKITNVKEIEGEYENKSSENENLKHRNIKSYIDFRNKIKDTTEIRSVKINILSDKKIQFLFKTINGTENNYESKYKITKNGLILLKNKNFRLSGLGLPYILGGYQVNKTELGLTKQNQLILNGVKVDEGAILIILPASFPKTNFREKYNKK